MTRIQLRTALIALGALPLGGCGSAESIDAQREGRMVFVDTVTGQAVVSEITSDVPAVQPLTGKRTLMPGLYCPDCQAWHAVPPPDQINRRPGTANCPRSGGPLTIDGPWPGETE